MKKIFLGTLFCSVLLSAQKSNCSKFETELGNLKKEVAELNQQINYYKESLKLLEPLSIANTNDLEFTITKIVGNRKNKNVTVTYIYRNTSSETRKYYQGSQAYFVDDRGNQSETYEVMASPNNIRVESIQPDLPMKGFVKFKVDELDFPIIKLLNLKFSYVGSDIYKNLEEVVFKNVPVTWE